MLNSLFTGGMKVVGDDSLVASNCSLAKDNCGVIALVDTAFTDNTAETGGGAIFVDRVPVIRIRCSATSANEKLAFFSEKQWRDIEVFGSTGNVCPSWNANEAIRYGPDVASFASGVHKTIDGASTDMISILDNHHYVVQNYSSGKPLPTVFLIASDDLRQYPAVTADGKRIIVVLSSPDGLFESNMSRQLHPTGESLTLTGFATPGNHTLLIEFEEADYESIEIVVEVRSCAMGEVPLRNGTLCEPCSSSTYSFPSEGDSVCQTCPENGICETRVILPDEGYWHLTPCSKHIDKCITHDACVREEREQDLAKMTANIESCDVDEVFIKNYTEAQCREVRYHGSHHLMYLELVV